MSKLNWISDENLNTAVTNLLAKAKEAEEKVKQEIGKNVIDPFSALFVMSGFNLDYEMWYKTESTRQAQKSLQNHVGEFHQIILGSVDGWNNLKTGNIIDIESTNKNIIAEIKNKHNTVTKGKLAGLYYSLENLVMRKKSIYKDYISYYVEIIPKRKKRYNIEFTPSDRDKGAKCPTNPLIRQIDGASFYDLVTGNKNSLSNLYNILPLVIEECSQGKYILKEFEELRTFFDSAFEVLD